MKSFAARLSVVVLAATGFAASTVVSVAATRKHEIKPIIVGNVGCPPMCMPRDPTHCGMD